MLLSSTVAQNKTTERIPHELCGRWKVTKELSTRTISCWGEKEAREIVGTTIEYSPNVLKWRNLRSKTDVVKVRTITADQFNQENSSPSVNGSQIDFGQLGIIQKSATQITLEHADAHITEATSEFPGDNVLVKAPNKIIFSLCNVWFEATRVAAK